jgi:DNA gyrase subunit A
MEIGLVRRIDIDEEMQQAYLDYAMSVIVARALPDARDGLKPVHRRILYAMYDMGLGPNSGFKKSARIVGEVLGKYHPHGDMAVYEAMARMAQDFSMRGLLVDGQGNFGSVDGDPPAAMRYTEARLTALASHMLGDINKNTVDFSDNFDGTLTEPDVLPAALPNLLLNGATGIAVGMATSIPPHNLGEVIDALVYMLANWEKLDEVSIDDLMRFVKGPDFPTGGVIIQENGGDTLASAYATGRGRVTIQANAHMEEMSRGRNRIIVTELPYMTNKAGLVERIASLVREERLDGIADLRDESDRHGMRIVIELNKAADPETVLRELYKNTQMRSTFSIILLALVEGEPRMISLKQALRVYLEHRLVIIKRRSEYDLERARQRAHILEGLRVALKNLDEVIAMIRRAPDAETARERLMKRFKLTEVQAQAILDMPLRRLAALERKKIEEEYKELQDTIKTLESLLRSPKKMRQVVADELLAVKETYNDPRRTRIVSLVEGESKASMLTATDLVAEQPVWAMITPEGLVSRSADDKLPRLSGNDLASTFVQASTRDTLYLVATNGEAAAIPMHVLPQASKPGEGISFDRVSPLGSQHKLAGAFSLPARAERPEEWFQLSVTRQGMVKKSPLAELPGPSAQVFTLVKVNPGDSLGWLHFTDGNAEILLVTAKGMGIRFKEEEVRPMGLVAAGVMGIKLQKDDQIVGAERIEKKAEVLLVASDGTGKRVEGSQIPTQGRYGQGVILWKLPGNVQVAGMAVGKGTTRVVICLDKLAPKSIRLDEAPSQGRVARGKRILDLKTGQHVTGLVPSFDRPLPVPGRKLAAAEPNGAGGRRKIVEPKADRPKSAKPKADKPKASKSKSAKPTTGKSRTAKPKAEKPPAGKSKETKPTSGKAKAGKTTTGKSKPVRPTTGKPTTGKVNADKKTSAKPTAGRSKASKPPAGKSKDGKPRKSS